jgi:hypothetical protein
MPPETLSARYLQCHRRTRLLSSCTYMLGPTFHNADVPVLTMEGDQLLPAHRSGVSISDFEIHSTAVKDAIVTIRTAFYPPIARSTILTIKPFAASSRLFAAERKVDMLLPGISICFSHTEVTLPPTLSYLVTYARLLSFPSASWVRYEFRRMLE